jgi:hypothetical protein
MYYIQADYLFYMLVVSFNKSLEVATSVMHVYGFVSVVVGFGVGLTCHVRQLKWFVMAGGAITVLAFGPLIHFGGGRTAIVTARLLTCFTAVLRWATRSPAPSGQTTPRARLPRTFPPTAPTPRSR